MESKSVENFLYTEADLLDERRYQEWVDLFTDDGIYWVPSGMDGDPKSSVALVYDSAARLQERVIRMKSRFYWAQQPPTSTSRLIGNIVTTPGQDDELNVKCRILITLLRRNRQGMLSATCRYRLKTTPEGFRIREKMVRLLERDEFFDNLTFLP